MIFDIWVHLIKLRILLRNTKYYVRTIIIWYYGQLTSNFGESLTTFIVGFSTSNYNCVWVNTLSLYSYRKRDIEHLLTLTDSFTWEELPTRDPDTGYLTTAGYIPIIQGVTKKAVMCGYAVHSIQTTIRIVMNRETIYPLWFPIDASRSPLYEIIIVMQVCSHCEVN
jgi:hypothetical protein